MAKAPRGQGTNPERSKIASRGELNAFLAELAKLQIRFENEPETEQQEALRSYLQKFDRQDLQMLMGRAFADALKSPSQKLGIAKPPSGTAPRARKARSASEGKRRSTSDSSRSRSGRPRKSR